MLFKEFGEPGRPAVFLLHGGGLSWWATEEAIGLFSPKYRVVAPVIDGHGEDGARDFLSIEDSAARLIAYIDERCGGRAFLIAGLSLGAQIVAEALSHRGGIADYAVIESALVIPLKALTSITAPVNRAFYGLIQKHWYARIQAKTLMLPDCMFERYYEDSLHISRQTLVNIGLSNGNYALKLAIRDASARVLVVVGEKELGVMRSSARLLHETIGGSELIVADGLRHGEFSLRHPDDYQRRVEEFIGTHEKRGPARSPVE